MKKHSRIQHLILPVFISVLIGIMGGVSSSIFLYTLQFVTQLRLENQIWLFTLPLAGFLVGKMYDVYGNEVTKGNDLIFEEMKFNKKKIPFKMALLIFIGTILTHLSGGSAGREGTAIQMSVSINEQLNSITRKSFFERYQLICLAIAAGFSGVFATPFTAIVFAFEVFIIGKLKLSFIIHIFITSFTAYAVSEFLQTTHAHYSISSNIEFSIFLFIMIVFAGVFFGLMARFYVLIHFLFSILSGKLFKTTALSACFTGAILLLLYFLTNETKYYGLGLETISAAFNVKLEYYDFLFKSLYTAFTIGFGFKGGEVTPLFFIGASAGNAFAVCFNLPLDVFAALGFISVFAGASNTPIACLVMGAELFGIQYFPVFVSTCFIAFFFSGKMSIYKMQQEQHAYYRLLKLENMINIIKSKRI